MQTFKVKTIIHGHFYQPPRDDPWTDQIEVQSSSYPYKNWNIRITKECYAPNCYSRVLDGKGKIIDIINNYRYISFNFGPTLLNWLEKKENDVYNLILESDKLSVNEHNGHGNAIAQVYNHVIMPLQNRRDKITQIKWGLKDFKYRFNRDSEGLWLSETAVDYETVDLLIDHGIKFIILSPNQAKAYRLLNEEKWIDVNDKHLNTKKIYKIIRKHGEIAVFYYDKRLSSAVSFEHMLHDSDVFARSIIHNATDENDLITIATDGEVYGHHEPFGDMCLARLIKEYHLKQNKIQFMNFGECLDLFSPEYETSLYLGEDGLGSSWSCYHGVGRWYKNCGCQTGGDPGWNQEWRKPLRDAFDTVKEDIDKIYENELLNYVNDPWALRNDYIDYIVEGYKLSSMDFLKRHINKTLNKQEIIKILKLLESQKHALFMYTSCAWFFTELTGIETVQNIKYAIRSIFLLDEKNNEIRQKFVDKIILAKSNIKNFNNGKWIIDNWILPFIQNLPHFVNNFVALFITNPNVNIKNFEIFDSYGYENFSINKIINDKSVYEGFIKIFNKKGYVNGEFKFLLNKINKNNYNIYIFDSNINDFDKYKNDLLTGNEINKNDFVFIYSEKDLIAEIRDYIINYNYEDIENNIYEVSLKLINDIKPLLIYYKNNKIALNDIYKNSIRFIADSFFVKIYKSLIDFPDRDTYAKLIELFEFINYFSINVNTSSLRNAFSEILYKKLSQVDENDLDSDIYKKALIMVEFSYKVKIDIEKSKSENFIYKLLKKKVPLLIQQINSDNEENIKAKYLLQLRNLVVLAEIFNIDVTEEKNIFFSQFKQINPLSSSDIFKTY